jgi:hypothetical protein
MSTHVPRRATIVGRLAAPQKASSTPRNATITRVVKSSAVKGSAPDTFTTTSPKEDISLPKEDISSPKEDISSPKEDISSPKEDISSSRKDSSSPTRLGSANAGAEKLGTDISDSSHRDGLFSSVYAILSEQEWRQKELEYFPNVDPPPPRPAWMWLQEERQRTVRIQKALSIQNRGHILSRRSLHTTTTPSIDYNSSITSENSSITSENSSITPATIKKRKRDDSQATHITPLSLSSCKVTSSVQTSAQLTPRPVTPNPPSNRPTNRFIGGKIALADTIKTKTLSHPSITAVASKPPRVLATINTTKMLYIPKEAAPNVVVVVVVSKKQKHESMVTGPTNTVPNTIALVKITRSVRAPSPKPLSKIQESIDIPKRQKEEAADSSRDAVVSRSTILDGKVVSTIRASITSELSVRETLSVPGPHVPSRISNAPTIVASPRISNTVSKPVKGAIKNTPPVVKATCATKISTNDDDTVTSPFFLVPKKTAHTPITSPTLRLTSPSTKKLPPVPLFYG